MRKAVLLAVLFVLVSLASVPPASAATCAATCSYGVTLGCTATTCSAANFSYITCNSTTVTCSTAESYCLCSQDCIDQCADACELSPNACNWCITNCRSNNGCTTQPAFTSCG